MPAAPCADDLRVNRRRVAAVLAVTLPLALASVALLLWAAPFWTGQARGVVDRNRWPEQREQIVAAVGAAVLPEGYRESECGARATDPTDRCWWTDRAPDDTVADLESALLAVAATDLLVAHLDAP